MKAHWSKYTLNFAQPGGTSRGVLTTKDSYLIYLESAGNTAVGECGLLRGLSCDDRPDYEQQLQWTCDNIHLGLDGLYAANHEFPSIQFGVEMAFKNLEALPNHVLFASDFTRGTKPIPINGLIWMGSIAHMQQQIEEKLAAGFRCLKLKIGALDWAAEHDLLQAIRKRFSAADLELRVDANGGFSAAEAPKVLEQLAALEVHSVEQIIPAGQWEEMAALCAQTPTPIALDEELIGLNDYLLRARMLDMIRPQYIILKPSFIGGWRGSEHWIALAEARNIGWWVTSALESNIGLNAIAQWTYTLQPHMPQGLGTGGLFTNNKPAALQVKSGGLWFDPQVPNQFTAAV